MILLLKNITDDAFFNRNWAGVCEGLLGRTRIGVGRVHGLYVFGLGGDCFCVDRPTLEVEFLCKKNEKKRGSARASPVTAPMPKSVSF